MQNSIQLLPDEEILYEDDRAVLTNRRLIGNFGRAKDGEFDHSELREVGPPNKFNGGHVGRRDIGIKLTVGGIVVLVALSYLQPRIGIPNLIEVLVFLASSLAATVGIYLLVNGLFRNAPNTTVIFPVLQGEDIIASYPEWDNPEADELIRRFARIKRGIGT